MIRHRQIALANESDRFAMVPIDNEMTVSNDGWAKIVPYGDSIKERTVRDAGGNVVRQRFIQRLTLENATEIAAKANSIWGKLRRFRLGVQIFRGHPDLAKHSPQVVGADRNAPEEELGLLSELEAREDGLYGRPVLNSAGRMACENEGLKWFSPFWWVRVVGQEGDATVVEPHELISAGLTDRPNIQGGDALANQQTEQERIMREKLLAMLGLPPETTDDAIIEAIGAMKSSMETALEDCKTKEAAMENEKKRANEMAAKVVSIEPALANERARADKLTLDAAVRDGRITLATLPEWQAALANNDTRDAKLAELSTIPAKEQKTQTGALGSRKPTNDMASTASAKLITLANEAQKISGGDWTAAWNKVLRENPALAEAMQKPATA